MNIYFFLDYGTLFERHKALYCTFIKQRKTTLEEKMPNEKLKKKQQGERKKTKNTSIPSGEIDLRPNYPNPGTKIEKGVRVVDHPNQ
jgi:hypothetical protein